MDDKPSGALQSSCHLMADFMARRKEMLARLKQLVERETDSMYADRMIELVTRHLLGW